MSFKASVARTVIESRSEVRPAVYPLTMSLIIEFYQKLNLGVICSRIEHYLSHPRHHN